MTTLDSQERPSAPRDEGFIGKLFRVIRTRPTQIPKTIRMVVLFYSARMIRSVFPVPGLVLGKNVRLQKNSSVTAEAPGATVHLHDHSIVYEDSHLEAYGKGTITVGEGSILGGAKIVSRERITIGKRFLSSWNVFIQDFDPHPVDPQLRRHQMEEMVARFRPAFDLGGAPVTGSTEGWCFPSREIVIGDDVWVGANVVILKGARIGNGSIVAAGAVVTAGDYPERSIIGGNPAEVVRAIAIPTP